MSKTKKHDPFVDLWFTPEERTRANKAFRDCNNSYRSLAHHGILKRHKREDKRRIRRLLKDLDLTIVISKVRVRLFD